MAASIWLVWAFPRLHPAARLGLQFDREGYLARARGIAARQHVDVTGWRGYAKAESLAKNQQFRIEMPNAPMATEFPPGQVATNFLPAGEAAGARVTMRPDGRPLSWKLPVPANPAAAPDMGMVHDAMNQMAGPLVTHFSMTAEGVKNSDGMGYKWKAVGAGQDSPTLGIEESVRNGVVAQASTVFTMPAAASRQFDSFPAARVAITSLWYLILLAGIVIPVLREGSGSTARAMKDRSAIALSCAAAAIFFVAAIVEWDDDLVSVPAATGFAMEMFGAILGAVVIGLLFYTLNAATALNAREHAPSVRGFRLMGAGALFSRTVGAELLGGWLLAPLIVSVPLIVAATLRAPAFGGYEDGVLLRKLPVIDAVANSVTQQTLGIVALLGVLIPLALRFSRKVWFRRTLIAVLAFLSFAMLDAPFRSSQAANLVCAALNGLTLVWLYSRFGMLGALAGHCSARILVSAGALLVQPAAGLQSSGWGVLGAFAALGAFCLIAAVRAPEAVAELYGESGARLQARSRREELLAEFNVARSAQQQMLPSQPPELEGYTIAASCEPAREVGGDLYDFLRLEDGRWGIGVADVSGKGVPAALYMTLTKGLLCAAAQDSGDPRQILGAVNKHLRTVTKRKMFVTMALGVLDPEARRVDYVRAGHNPVVWRRTSAGETRFLSGPGIGLGIAGPALFGKTLTTETIDLEPGDALVFYSDGLTEAMNDALEQFGEDRLIAAVERADGMHATATRDSILSEVSEFLEGGHSQDDLTIAVLRVN